MIGLPLRAVFRGYGGLCRFAAFPIGLRDRRCGRKAGDQRAGDK